MCNNKSIDIPNVGVSEELPDPDLTDSYVDVPESPFDYKPKKKFKHTWLGRTITGKTLAGKALLLSLAGVLAKFTGIDLSPLITPTTGEIDMIGIEGLGLEEILLTAGIAVLGFILNSAKGLLQDIVAEVKDIVAAVQAAKAPDSEGGSSISDAERILIWKEVEDLVTILYKRLLRNRLLKLLGVKTRVKEDK